MVLFLDDGYFLMKFFVVCVWGYLERKMKGKIIREFYYKFLIICLIDFGFFINWRLFYFCVEFSKGLGLEEKE